MKSKLSLMMIITLITALLLPEVVLSRHGNIEEPTGLPKKNKALYLGWGGYVDTQVNFSSFFNADHTVMAWFMPQYPHAYAGPIFTVNGSGGYWIGQDDYRIGDGGDRKGPDGKTVFEKGKPVFAIQVGTQRRTYLLDQLIAGKWAHIAIVRRNNQIELYVNGSGKAPVDLATISKEKHTWSLIQDMTVSANSIALPQGTLRLGRVKPERSDNQQAYGLLDDVAVFNKALSQVEIIDITQKKRLSGKEAGLLAGLCFDQPGPNDWKLPPNLDSWWLKVPRTYRVAVSTNRTNEQDKTHFDNPLIIGETSKALRLPFQVNEVWLVIQGYDDPGSSHNSYAAFSYDFGKHPYDPNIIQEYPKGTSLAPVYAAVTAKADYYTRLIVGGQTVRVKLDENEHLAYQHLEFSSLNPKFTDGKCGSPEPKDCFIQEPKAQTILQGDIIAEVNPTDNHLHVSASNSNGFTIPAAFADYEVSTDGGKTWAKVFRGHPKAGQLIKRTGISAAQNTVNLQCSTSNASVIQKKIKGETKFEHKAFVSITTGESWVFAGTFIKYSVNGYPPQSFKVVDELGIQPFTKMSLGSYSILLDDKEPWPDGCSASYTKK